MGQQPKRLGQLKTGQPMMAYMNSMPQFFFQFI
jgi:hypothetical protein